MRSTKTLTACALLAALAVVLGRLLIPMPNDFTRFSIEAVPIFLAGMFFGPLAGGLVGFVQDFVGCLFSGYGYNPILCIPPIFYGVCAGLFRPLLQKNYSVWSIALAFLPSVVLGSILYQSMALGIVYKKGFWYFFSTRSVQFAITYVLDVAIVYALCKANTFKTVLKRGKK